MIFSNPCKGNSLESTLKQLQLYKDNGHLIGNHTCSHPRLDDVGYDEYTKDIAKADRILKPLMFAEKYFRYPYLNESNKIILRDKVRSWLKEKQYRMS